MTYAEDKLRHWGAPVPQHLVHGQRTRARSIYGCDCATCLPTGLRDAPGGTPGRVRRLKSRRKLRGTPVPPGTKHGIYTYTVYGCRCDVCTTAKAGQGERRRNAWRERARGIWTEAGESDILCWPPRTAGSDWRCPTCGQTKEVAA